MSAVEGGILASPDPIVVPTPTTMSDLVTLCRGRGLHLPTHPTVANLTKIIASYNAELRLGGDYNVKALLLLSMQRAGVASLLCSLRRDLAAFRRVAVLEDTPTLAVHDPPVNAESVSPRPAADISPRASATVPAVTGSPEGTLSSLELARERLEFEKSQQKDQMDLARRRLDFEERRLVAACGLSTSPTSPVLLSNLLPSTPVSPHPPLRTNGVPIELDRPSPSIPWDMPPPLPRYPLAVPSAAIEPPLSGPLMGVLQSLVWAAHADPRAPGVSSGLAAIGAAAKVTPHKSPLGARLNSLKRAHNMYARMLSWTTDALISHPLTSVQLPSVNVRNTPVASITHTQWSVLQSAFSKVDTRPASARTPGVPFDGATYHNLRDAIQGKNMSRRRLVTGDALRSPIFKARVDAARAH